MSIFNFRKKSLDDEFLTAWPKNTSLFRRLPVADLANLDFLNVGAGSCLSALARQLSFLPFGRLDFIDIHKPYLDEAKNIDFRAKEIGFIHADIRGFDTSAYDCVMMFDILEHLEKEDSLAVMKNIKCRQIIFIPLEKVYRPNIYGAKSQDHLSLWTEDDFKKLGYQTEVLKNYHHEGGNIFDALWAIKN